MRDLSVNAPTRKIQLPRWALCIIVINAIAWSSDALLPLCLGVFALLFNIAQGKLAEGIVVGCFAFAVMLFLMHIAQVRKLNGSGELQQFVNGQMRSSRLCRNLVKLLAVMQPQ